MSTPINIIVFSHDKNLLILLQGYCFAKNITITALEFTEAAIHQLAKFNAGLVVIPISLLCSEQNTAQIILLKREVSSCAHLKACVLKDDANDLLPRELSAWIDSTIQNPIDLEEFDRYLNIAFSGNANPVERRQGERRYFQERRACEASQNECEVFQIKNQPCSRNIKESSSWGFRLDRLNRCLFINGSKIDLTPKEFELVELLLTDVNRIFMADEIVKHLWPENHRATKSDLYQYMHLLRKKVEKDPNHPKWLMNIKGYGYKLNLN